MVDILWPDGETEVIKGFITEHDAVKWITEHEYSKAWHGNTNDRSPRGALARLYALTTVGRVEPRPGAVGIHDTNFDHRFSPGIRMAGGRHSIGCRQA